MSIVLSYRRNVKGKWWKDIENKYVRFDPSPAGAGCDMLKRLFYTIHPSIGKISKLIRHLDGARRPDKEQL
jgi:hypothetical protein